MKVFFFFFAGKYKEKIGCFRKKYHVIVAKDRKKNLRKPFAMEYKDVKEQKSFCFFFFCFFIHQTY